MKEKKCCGFLVNPEGERGREKNLPQESKHQSLR